MQNHLSAWRGAPRFKEAQMPLRDFSIAGKRELAQAAALSPRAQEISDGGSFDCHVSTLDRISTTLSEYRVARLCPSGRKVQSKNNRVGCDKPGHDRARGQVPQPDKFLNLTRSTLTRYWARSNYLRRNRRLARLRGMFAPRGQQALALITKPKEHSMSIAHSAKFLRTVLLIDAATCVATGLLMTLGADILARLTAVPAPLLLYAGLSLFPVAIFIALVGTRDSLVPAAVWVVIIGNAAWVAGSALLLFGGMIAPNASGYVFIGAQAAAVALLAELEYFGLRQTLAVAH
jgi:hypothetical protein